MQRCVALLALSASGAGAYVTPESPRPLRGGRQSRVLASSPDARPHVAVVGGGWGGWGAAKALCEQGCRVTLLDALPDPTGATPLRSASGKPVENGVRGFWKDYPNINALVDELGLDASEVFTPFTNSSFYSPDGLEATAPVFSEGKYATLPSPLGQMLATFPLFERLPLADRASIAGLLYAILDLDRDEATFAAYDRMSAHDLFIRMGLTKRLVDDFLRPTLLVGLFKPPEELSAAVAMELLYYYALAHQVTPRGGGRGGGGGFLGRGQGRCCTRARTGVLAKTRRSARAREAVRRARRRGGLTPRARACARALCSRLTACAPQDSFDVRWIGKKSISELLIAPLARTLVEQHGLTVMGGCYVQSLQLNGVVPSAARRARRTADSLGDARDALERSAGTPPAGGAGIRVCGVRYIEQGAAGTVSRGELTDLSAVVLALGVKGMRAVVQGSPDVARECPELAAAASLSGIDVVSVRLWLDRVIPTRTPANVLSRFPGLRGAGGTFFMLDQLQCSDEAIAHNWGGDPAQGSVVACDLYNAGALLALSDDDIVELLIGELLPAAVPEFGAASVVDAWVGRSLGAVSWFAPGSFALRPPLQTSVPNLVCAGDWVRMGRREHGAKGLCQERAFASGLQAANALGLGAEVPVKQVRPAEPQVALGRALNKGVMGALSAFGLASPWVR